ncbi:hypothetical protein OPT61_g1847 [Boeremia exigua]|uniref:Uncharacterized protein n=1 Tax=Boeremia exigua TaxID=749465 RepID=A0ACC2INP3_9PLEO|nr:hypothetical protein OPT61_g1847 [Boeremia exigua]
MEASNVSLANGVERGTGIFDDVLTGRVPVTFAVIGVTLIVLAILRYASPTLDPKEPPLLKSRVPLIGHIIGIIQHQTTYHKILSDNHASYKCATLPMLNGKLYVVYDPYLVQQVLRNNIASFDPFQEKFAQKVFDLNQVTYDKIRLNPKIFADFTDAIHRSFRTESLAKMNLRWLTDFAAKIDPISQRKPVIDPENAGQEKIVEQGAVEVENLFLWCRDFMTLATTTALYGDHDPFVKDKSLIEASWVYEEAVPYFLLSLFPSLTMPKSYKARKQLQDTFSKYYTAGHHISDPTTATVTLNRANALTEYGFTGNEIGLLECILPVVSTLNAIPTLYWLLLFVLPQPTLMEKLRAEIAAFVDASQPDSKGARIITMDISRFETALPLLVSCYRETLRLSNHAVCNRHMMEDLTITDQDGRSYLLKKGVDIQLPAGVTHRHTDVWGSDVSQFRADRFVPSTSKATDADRVRKLAYMPFGGGRHLCPGRNFAFAEIIGSAAVLLLGFDIKPLGMSFEDVQMRGPRLSSGTVKPVDSGKGLGARVTPREEFANVAWRFRA